MKVNREKFMFTLFDQADTTFDRNQVDLFINNVCDTLNPQYISFYSRDWYADVSCLFNYNDCIDSGNIILELEVYSDSSVKWVMAGINSKFLSFPGKKDSLHFISPVSHGADFISLYNIFKDGKNVLNYIPDDFEVDKMTYFATLMYFNKIKVEQVYRVKYHFLQIPEWAFTVEYFNRKELQSGWLISDLTKMTNRDKAKYLKNVLTIETTK